MGHRNPRRQITGPRTIDFVGSRMRQRSPGSRTPAPGNARTVTHEECCADTSEDAATPTAETGCDHPPPDGMDLSGSGEDPLAPPFAGVQCRTVPPPLSCTGTDMRSQLATILEVMDIHHKDRLEAARVAHAQSMDQLQSQRSGMPK